MGQPSHRIFHNMPKHTQLDAPSNAAVARHMLSQCSSNIQCPITRSNVSRTWVVSRPALSLPFTARMSYVLSLDTLAITIHVVILASDDSRMGRTCSSSMTRSIKGGFFDLASTPWFCFGVRCKRTVNAYSSSMRYNNFGFGHCSRAFLLQVLIFLLNSYPFLSLVASLALCNDYLKSSP